MNPDDQDEHEIWEMINGLYERLVFTLNSPEAGYEEAMTEIQTELEKFKDVKGPTYLVTHKIRLKENTEPIKFRYAPRNPVMLKIMQDEMDKMEAESIIEDSESPWNSPIVLVKKNNLEYRFYVDYSKNNGVTIKDAYPLPHINAMLDKIT